MKNKLVITVSSLFVGILIFGMTTGFKPSQAKKPWPVPDKNAKMANPVKSDAAALTEGKALWTKHCSSCHGKIGHGDGTKAAQLKTEPGNFATPAVQKQSDGTLFFKISEGREDMPSFKKKIPDADEIWNIINYMRTLTK
ncbi:MAG: cytochrome c [Bacteroidetes bacterium]|nr:cytochrome c [Bacteroidota bacterium]